MHNTPRVKSIIIACLFIILLLSVVFYTILSNNNSQQLNLILISVDTLRADHIGVYGYNKNITPNIDLWAQNSFLFTNVRTVVPYTYPSFAALMTGVHPFRSRITTNVNSSPLSINSQTLAKILKQKNYNTAAFITNFILKSEYTNLNDGFDVFNLNESWNYRDKDYNRIIDDPILWLERNRKNKFFLWVHLSDPHIPYDPPDDLRCKFDTNKYCISIESNSITKDDQKKLSLNGCRKEEKRTIEILQTLYDGEVAQTDKLIGKILDKLKELGLDRNSLVVLYGDHGESFDHDYFTHGKVLYESSVRIPLIIKHPWKNIESLKRDSTLIDNTDISPTLLDLLGIPLKNKNNDGMSFSSVFENKLLSQIIPLREKKYVFSINNELTKFSVYDGIYKYIYSLDNSCLFNNQKEELYDIRIDLKEENNIISSDKILGDKYRRILMDHLAPYNLPQSPITELEIQKNNKDFLDKFKEFRISNTYEHNAVKKNDQDVLEKLKELGY